MPTALFAGYALHRAHARMMADIVPTRVKRSHRASMSRAFWRFTGPRSIASVAQLALQRVDVLLVAALAGLGAAGLYAVAGRFVVLGQFANQGISQAVQPRLAEALAVKDRTAANTLYQTATGWLVLLTWPLYLLVMTYAPAYLGIFGTAYRDAAPIVVVLAAAMLVATGCGMVDIVLSMAGRTAWNLGNVLVALGLTISLDLALIPRLGALGAAIGLAAAVVANNVLPLAQVGLGLGYTRSAPAGCRRPGSRCSASASRRGSWASPWAPVRAPRSPHWVSRSPRIWPVSASCAGRSRWTR